MVSGQNVFISGAAGTGKSYLAEAIISNCQKSIIACAPTGMAAQNIGGATIHSVFKLPKHVIFTPSKLKTTDMVRSCDIILIDEVSMIRRDVFDAISSVIMRENRRRRREGVQPIQLICMGDFCQLPPVVKKNEQAALSQLYDIPERQLGDNLFAFQSKYWQEWKFSNFYLTKIIRQDNVDFIKALDKARLGDASCLEYIAKHQSKTKPTGAVILAGRNRDVDRINNEGLADIGGKERLIYGTRSGEVPIDDLPAPMILHLKANARVMCTRNQNGLMNGDTGTVSGFGLDGSGGVEVYMRADKNGKKYKVTEATWSFYDYKVVDGKVRPVVVGSYRQLPLKLCWAVSIHKSQGQTYDAVELVPDSWDYGMLYVALSRVRDISNMHLSRPISPDKLIASSSVIDFYAELIDRINP